MGCDKLRVVSLWGLLGDRDHVPQEALQPNQTRVKRLEAVSVQGSFALTHQPLRALGVAKQSGRESRASVGQGLRLVWQL